MGCVAAVLGAAIGVSFADGSECTRYVEANVYLVSWELETRARLNPEDVRRIPDCAEHLTKLEQVHRVCEALSVPSCSGGKSEPEDARFVVDFKTAAGETTTYYASWFSLLNGDSTCTRTIDAEFREQFRCNRGPAFGG